MKPRGWPVANQPAMADKKSNQALVGIEAGEKSLAEYWTEGVKKQDRNQ